MRVFLSKYLPALAGALLLVLACGWLANTGKLTPLELRLLDFRFLVRGDRPAPSEIVLVTYDEESFQAMEGWPWPRTYHAEAVQKMTQWGAKVIAFDQLFFDPSKLLPEGQDAMFTAAMAKAGNAVIASKFEETVKVLPDPERPGEVTRLKILKYQEPLDMFRAAAPVGYLNMIKDADGYVRRIPILHKAGSGVAFAFSFMSYLRYRDLTLADIRKGEGKNLIVGDTEIPLGKTNSLRISFVGEPGLFPRVPFYKILKDQVDPDLFRGKIVMVGPTAAEFHDSFYTPFYGAARQEMPGVEIHANALATLLSEDFLRDLPKNWTWWTLFLYGLVMALLASHGHPFRIGLWAVALTATQLGLSLHYFLHEQLVYPTAPGIVQIWSTYLLTTVYRTFIGERREKQLKKTFKKYVSKDVVDEILKKRKDLKMAGDKKIVTVLFSDIRSFTSMSEKMDPEDLIRELNDYFEAMIRVIFRNGGTLDKFIGDAIMAVWGSPITGANDAKNAVRAAWEMHEALVLVNAKRAEAGRPPLKTGIGINTGPVVVGNLGSPERMEFTVIGDTVNTACRVESQTHKGEILINSSTYALVKDMVEVKAVAEPTKVKGKEEALQLYELMGINGLRKTA